MAVESHHARRLMTTAEAQFRSSDDMRRSAQMAAAQTGDRGAYEALLRDCVPLIKAIAARQGVPPDRSDDVVQDVLLTVHRVRHTYDPARSFTAWLRVITERRAIDLLRHVRRRDARELHVPLAFEAYPDEHADPARGIESADAAGRINEALATLPPRQREAVEALVLKEQSLTEAAAATRRTRVALKVNLHRALKALRQKLERREWTP
ncbi:MAG TPA: sigma-70 family RNA polymerase sigma factor [Pseudolabrys sp.]|jgi:RNA polymerase sigma-70 factor (ECF subfamily)